jgi:hypothetical protein
MENEAVSITAFTENFSSIPFMAPPPCMKWMVFYRIGSVFPSICFDNES